MLLLILMLLSTSCRTSPPVIEYRDRPIPAVAWATFPDPKGIVKIDDDAKNVTMPLAYWMAVTRYVIDTSAGIKTIEAYRDE